MTKTRTLQMLGLLAVVLLAATMVYRYAAPSDPGQPAADSPAGEPTTDVVSPAVVADEPAKAEAVAEVEAPETEAVEQDVPDVVVVEEEPPLVENPPPPRGTAAEADELSPQAVIEADAEAQLVALRNSCKTKLMGLGLSYLSAIGDEERGELIASGKAEVAACTAKFEAIVAETEQALEEGGFATDVIASYRETFEAEIAAGLAMADGL